MNVHPTPNYHGDTKLEPRGYWTLIETFGCPCPRRHQLMISAWDKDTVDKAVANLVGHIQRSGKLKCVTSSGTSDVPADIAELPF